MSKLIQKLVHCYCERIIKSINPDCENNDTDNNENKCRINIFRANLVT